MPRRVESGAPIVWGPSPFGRAEPDDADGRIAGGYRFRRGPDGELLGIAPRKESNP